MQNKTLSEKYLDSRKFKLLYDYYAYLFYLEEKRPKKNSAFNTNLLDYFSNKSESKVRNKSSLSEGAFVITYLSLFTQLDLVKMKTFSINKVVRVKDIFNDILFEKRNILSKKYKNRQIGVFESLIRLNYSRGIFLPGAWINLSSFYLQFNLFNNEKYSVYSDEIKILISLLLNCTISLPMKALQYQTLNNLSNESSILKDYTKFFRVGYLMRGYISRFDFNYSNTLLYLITENVIGMSVFFSIVKTDYIKNFVNSITGETDESSLYNKEEFISDICETNPTIRRSIFFTNQDKDYQKHKLAVITKEILKGMMSGIFTGFIVSAYEIGVKFYLGEMKDYDKKKFFNIIALNHKMNVFKFTFQYGLAYSFLRFYQEMESNNKNKY